MKSPPSLTERVEHDGVHLQRVALGEPVVDDPRHLGHVLDQIALLLDDGGGHHHVVGGEAQRPGGGRRQADARRLMVKLADHGRQQLAVRLPGQDPVGAGTHQTLEVVGARRLERGPDGAARRSQEPPGGVARELADRVGQLPQGEPGHHPMVPMLGPAPMRGRTALNERCRGR